MVQVVRVHEPGGAEAMVLDEVELGAPGPGEVRLRHTAIGINFIDVYHRTGFYKLPLPAALGVEGAGIVEAVGEGVSDLEPGDRVAYAGGTPGSYASERILPAWRAVKLPDGVSERDAAAVIFKGITAQYLVKSVWPVKPGDRVLVWAASGGVGQILLRWAKHLGAAQVVAIVGAQAKIAAAREAGADAVLLSSDDIPARVDELTGGAKMNVIYDSVGKDSFEATLNSLAPRGMFVSFGSASGAAPAIEPATLGAKGSLLLTRPSIAHYAGEPAEYAERARDVLQALADGVIVAKIHGDYALKDVAEAHRDLEGRKTQGALLLVP